MSDDQQYEVFQHYGTNAERLAFTPSPAAGIQPLYLWFETDTGNLYAYYTIWVLISGSGAASVFTILTSDPATPVDDTFWCVRSGTAPGDTVQINARIAGVTVTIAEITL